jgi:hypothetical protein
MEVTMEAIGIKDLTLEELILVEDALAMQTQMSKQEFVGCVMPSAKADNERAWDMAILLIRKLSTRRKAANEVERHLNRFRDDVVFPPCADRW